MTDMQSADTTSSQEPHPVPAEPATTYRYDAALAAEIEARWQDRWESEGTFEAPNPSGPLGDPDRVAARPKKYVLDMFPYPSGIGLHVGHPLGYIATDVFGRFKRMTGPQRAARAGLRRVRPAGRAVRRADRPAPAGHHRGQHRDDPPAAAPAGAGARPAAQRRDDRRRVLPVDAVDLPADLQRLVRRRGRPGPAVDELDRRRSRLGRATRCRDGRAWAELDDRPSGAASSTAPAGLPVRVAGQLVPGPGHRAGQRGGHRRRPQRARQLPGLQAQPAAVEACASPPTPTGCWTTWTALDWPESIKLQQRNWIGRSEGARVAFPSDGRRDRRLHHPAGHAVRRDVHGAGARAPDGRPLASGAWPRARAAVVDRRCRDAARRGAGLPAGGRAEDRPGAADRGPGQDRRVHRRRTRPTRSTATASRSSSPTTC